MRATDKFADQANTAEDEFDGAIPAALVWQPHKIGVDDYRTAAEVKFDASDVL